VTRADQGLGVELGLQEVPGRDACGAGEREGLAMVTQGSQQPCRCLSASLPAGGWGSPQAAKSWLLRGSQGEVAMLTATSVWFWGLGFFS